jgi:hypothetical protein
MASKITSDFQQFAVKHDIAVLNFLQFKMKCDVCLAGAIQISWEKKANGKDQRFIC